MILLDTNALIWLEQGHKRVSKLAGKTLPYVSPASILELQFLAEAGRIRWRRGSLMDVAHDPRWLVDDPPAIGWFEEACDIQWTRDPFDRLIVAHAQLRGWQLATADTQVLERMPGSLRHPL